MARRESSSALLALLAMTSVQTGAGVSVLLFDRFSPAGTAWLRLAWGAVVLLVLTRPRLRGRSCHDLASAVALGAASGVLTLLYFQALARIPLGTATTLEYLGPLAVAIAGLRRRIDLMWPLAAILGVLALTRPWSGEVDPVGIGYALGAAVGWACYIVLTQRVADTFTGLSGLAVSMLSASVVVAPFAGVPAVVSSLDGEALLVSLGAAILLPILPYACEMHALRHLTIAAFGTLMSLEPAIGTLIGVVLLEQTASWLQVLGIALVTTAGIGAIRSGARQDHPHQNGRVLTRPEPPANLLSRPDPAPQEDR